jgi:hypothetical protein
MCELSPVELAWAKLKSHVISRNTTVDMSIKRIEELVMEGLNEITAADWLVFSQHVAKLEQEFWANDGIMEDVIESFKITLRTSECATDSDNGSEDKGDYSDSECDSSLALSLDEESNDYPYGGMYSLIFLVIFLVLYVIRNWVIHHVYQLSINFD